MVESDPPIIGIVQRREARFKASRSLILQAISRAGAITESLDEVVNLADVRALKAILERCNVIVCDVTGGEKDVMYILGFAEAMDKPIILVSRRSDGFREIRSTDGIPRSIGSKPLLFYDMDVDDIEEFIGTLGEKVSMAIAQPQKFMGSTPDLRGPRTAFISYSHKDLEYVNRLMVHLRPLEKSGLIDPWVDSRLRAGDQWKHEITKALERATVAILVVSADFLASDFIVQNELPPILSKAESEGTRVLPLIVKPCRFARDRNLSIFQAVNNPSEPLAILDEGTQEQVFDNLAAEVERLVQK